jgi:hypothetical protein
MLSSSSFSSLFAIIVSNPPNHHDFDLGGPHLAYLVLIIAFFMVTVLMLISSSFSSLFVLAVNNPLGHHALDFGGPRCFFLVLAIANNPPSHDLDICDIGCSY